MQDEKADSQVFAACHNPPARTLKTKQKPPGVAPDATFQDGVNCPAEEVFEVKRAQPTLAFALGPRGFMEAMSLEGAQTWKLKEVPWLSSKKAL
jgi:hypothetical protein